MMHILWGAALLEAFGVTKNSCHLGFYQELEIRLKPREMAFFLCLTLDETIDLQQIFSAADLCKLRDKSGQMW